MPRPIKALAVTQQQQAELESMIRRPTAEQRMVRRYEVILCRSRGLSQEETGKKVGMSRPAVNSWEKRFVAEGLEGLNERKRSGRKPSLDEKIKEEIITEATRPPKGRTHWSTRSMARAKGVSNQTVHRLWKSNEI